MASEPLHIHIQNPAAAPGVLRLEARQLKAAVDKRPALKGRLKISADDGGETLPDSLAGVEVLLTVTKISLSEARKKAPQLRWVQTTFAGVEDLMADLPNGLQLANASGVHTEKGGEFILAAALMLAYRIPQFLADQAGQTWAPVFGPPIRESRVTILGVGAIGGEAARQLRRHGAKVTGVTRSGKAKLKLDRNATLDELDTILPETDILVSTLPDTPETVGLIDRKRINLLPEGAGIIVVGRAAPLNYPAILERLDAGTLGGAILDVFPEEPIPPNDRLWHTPRLVITPHCSVDDHTVYIDKCINIFLDNLERDLAGKRLNNLVDPKKGY